MDKISVWGFEIFAQNLTSFESEYLRSLPKEKPPVEWVWREMNRVWKHLNLDNQLPLKNQKISEFYSHPIWLVNGIFTTLDDESLKHRKKIAEFLRARGDINIADYGGGFGELALQIHDQNPAASIAVIEPYPSKVGLQRIKDIPEIKLLPNLTGLYDVVIAQDVLEHVEDPVILAYEICNHVSEKGVAIFANSFFPMIECHLPKTFHLRNTFPLVMAGMGMEYMGTIPGVNHAQIYRKKSTSLNINRARFIEKSSKLFGPQLNKCRAFLSKIKSKRYVN